jgi:ankyrin repeat protein
MTDKQNQLYLAAKCGDITKMYLLISSGADPFHIDKTGKNSIDYAIISDPLKAHMLLADLSRAATTSSHKEKIENYLKKMGGNYEN